MRYLIETRMCKVSLENPEITYLDVTHFPDLEQFAIDLTLEDEHGSTTTIYTGYLGENITIEPTLEEVEAYIMNVYLPQFAQ